MPRNAPERYGRAETQPLTQQEKTVLQAIYDHFREHGTWPTFITIDRPIRREHRWDTGAIILSLPRSLIVPPHPGHIRPNERDELRLHLLGIQACEGSSDDIERFVRTLRWLAECEVAYDPPPGSGSAMPQVTSQEVADYLRLDHADQLPLRRLLAMLQLDHWGLGGSGSNDDSWYVRLGQDIWRFRDVQSIGDVVTAREAWVAEGQPVLPTVPSPEPDRYFHVRLSTTGRPSGGRVLPDLSRDALESQVLAPYRSGRAIVIAGDIFRLEDITRIAVWRTDQPSVRLPRKRRAEGTAIFPSNSKWSLVTANGQDVTEEFITGAPGQPSAEAKEPVSLLPPAPGGSAYVDEKTIAAIRARNGSSKFDVTKLLALVSELNDNYVRRHTYAAHALLRALLDHVPPAFGFTGFREVANNYPWKPTDKRYMKKLADFRDQADDALHRQISADADVVDFDDMPARAYVRRLLQECAKQL